MTAAHEKLIVAAWKLENPSNDDSSTLHMIAVSALGAALAAWLRDEAAQHAAETFQPCGVESEYTGPALAVARVILGEQP